LISGPARDPGARPRPREARSRRPRRSGSPRRCSRPTGLEIGSRCSPAGPHGWPCPTGGCPGHRDHRKRALRRGGPRLHLGRHPSDSATGCPADPVSPQGLRCAGQYPAEAAGSTYRDAGRRRPLAGMVVRARLHAVRKEFQLGP